MDQNNDAPVNPVNHPSRVWTILAIVYGGLLTSSGCLIMMKCGILIGMVLEHHAFTPIVLLSPFFLLISVGLSHFYMPWYGISGVRRLYRGRLHTYLTMAFITIGFELFIGTWLVSLQNSAALDSIQLATLRFKDADFKKQWSYMQYALECCGLDNSTDYGLTIPSSCINTEASTNGSATVYYQTGCKKAIFRHVQTICHDGVVLSISCMILQLFGVSLFSWFCNVLKNFVSSRRKALKQFRVTRTISITQHNKGSEVPATVQTIVHETKNTQGTRIDMPMWVENTIMNEMNRGVPTGFGSDAAHHV